MKALSLAQIEGIYPLTGLVDSHIHLDSLLYQDDLEQVLQRAHCKGVRQMLIPSTELKSAQRIERLLGLYPQLLGALGIHPHQAGEFHPALVSPMRDMLGQGPWLAVGETGLECHYDFCPWSQQLASLEAHLDLAQEFALPLILHCRLAEEPLLRALEKRSLTGVVHCFTGGWDWAQRFLDLGFYLGVGGLVTVKSAPLVHEVAAKVPAQSWLLETDGPYLSPVPYRGYRNESCLLPLVLEKMAQLRGVAPQQLAQESSANAQRLFGLPDQD